MMKILVDADACPVKEIIVRLAKARGIPVTMLTDTSHQINDGYSTVITVDKHVDSVDFALMGLLAREDIVVTQDYGLAAMALGKGAKVIHQSGMMYTNDNIDRLLMDRHMGAKVRRSGGRTKGPAKRTKEDNARFESAFAKLLGFTNKHAVITGGANGIGRCIAETFLQEGTAVTIIDIENRPLEGAGFFHGDIGEKEVLEAFVGTLERPVDYLINNACIGRGGILSGCAYEDFEYVQRVGVTAPFYLTQLLVQKNLLVPNASIVNISSTRANQSQPDTEAYTAAKGGISALTHALAISLAGKARVNAISPGWIDVTGSTFEGADATQHPAGRVGVPRDIAAIVRFLCSDQASFITGENITVDGGMSRLMIYHNDHGWKQEG